MEDFNYAVAETFNNIAIQALAHVYEPMIQEIEKIKSAYGTLLRATAIGRDAAPNFPGQSTLDWQDLSVRWMKRKKSYPNNKFYQGLSSSSESLAGALFAMPGENLFGRTQLRTRMEQVQTDGFFNPRIRRRIETVYRDDRGRFARANEEARRTVRVTINPFPNVTSYGDSEALIQNLSIDDKNKTKLAANDSRRPIIGPYTEWFFERKIRNKIIEMAQRVRNGS